MHIKILGMFAGAASNILCLCSTLSTVAQDNDSSVRQFEQEMGRKLVMNRVLCGHTNVNGTLNIAPFALLTPRLIQTGINLSSRSNLLVASSASQPVTAVNIVVEPSAHIRVWADPLQARPSILSVGAVISQPLGLPPIGLQTNIFGLASVVIPKRGTMPNIINTFVSSNLSLLPSPSRAFGLPSVPPNPYTN